MSDGAGCRLTYESGQLRAELPGRDAIDVHIVYARPLSSRREVVLLDGESREVLTLSGLDELDEASRRAARAALDERYLIPRVTRVRHAELSFGTRYFEVDTDRGATTFAVREPGKNVTWLSDDHLVIRDTMAGRFEIPSLEALDARSRRWLQALL